VGGLLTEVRSTTDALFPRGLDRADKLMGLYIVDRICPEGIEGHRSAEAPASADTREEDATLIILVVPLMPPVSVTFSRRGRR
jgi:hypothetical protein